MRTPSAQTLLTVWDAGEGLAPVHQGLLLLAAACPERTHDELAHWSIGRRDAQLLALRETLFGPQVTGMAACPTCAERLEMTFRTEEIRARSLSDEAQPEPGLALQSAGYEVRFRLPNSADLAAMAQAAAGDASSPALGALPSRIPACGTGTDAGSIAVRCSRGHQRENG